ncbi:MAG: DnaA N-terminal domain-containing protein [Pseudomonadota bacterium]
MTALLVTAAQGDPVDARLALRLSLLITARYNWQRGTFAVGRREMARLWGVSERTVKRELAQLRSRGWVGVQVPAGRGRVTQYWIDLAALCQATMPHWDAVGPDFAARMVGAPEPAALPETNVVPLHPPRAAASATPCASDNAWTRAQERLAQQDPSVYNAWFACLTVREAGQGDAMHLTAPSRFHADYVRTHFRTRLLAALAPEDPTIRDVRVAAEEP